MCARLLWCSFLLVCTASARSPQRVLLLNSYHHGFEWSDDVTRGVRSGLRHSSGVELLVEYMDRRRDESQAGLEALDRLYLTKYEHAQPDLIIAADDAAVRFVISRRDRLFPGVPVVFCGVNEHRGTSAYVSKSPEQRPWLTGVLELVDVEATVNLALRLHPGTRNIVLVGEGDAAGYERNLALTHSGLSVRRILTQHVSLATIQRQLASLSKDSIILFTPFSRDSLGRQLTLAESTRFVVESSPVPVYGLSKNSLGFGIVGGKMSDGFVQGHIAGEMATSVLGGASPGALGIRHDVHNPYLFDYAVLKRWRISPASLPAGSQIVNRPHSFYEEHWGLIWTAILFVAGQSVAIVFLLLSRASRRRTEQQLQETQRQHMLALHAGRMGTWRWDTRTGLATWSEVQESLFGLPPGAYDGSETMFLQALHPEDRQGVQEAIQHALATGQDYQREYRVRWPDESEHWLAAQGRLVRSKDGRVEAVTGVSWDVTERRRVQAKLAASEAEIRITMDSTPALISYIGRDLRYRRVNRTYQEFFGIPAAEIAGRAVWEVLGDDYYKSVRPNLERALAGEAVAFETGYSQAGELRELSVRYTPDIAEDGTVRGVVVLVNDVTENKLAKEALARQAHQLARSNADLQQFAYVVSHDLQEPLRAVISYSQLLERRYADRLDADAKEFVGYIVGAAQRMSTLIRDLLAYSRVSGPAELSVAPVDMEKAVRWALANLQVAVENSRAEIDVKPLPAVLGNATQLIQVLQNLIGNALKYCGGRRPQISICGEAGAGVCTFSVTDNGVGIPAEYQDRVFGMFKRLHGREVPGTGIGLALCQRIVEAHGGRIWVESEPGCGSKFLFTLPLASRTDVAAA